MTTHREALTASYKRDLESSNVGRFLLGLLAACEVMPANRKLSDMDPADLLAERIREFAGFSDDPWLINEVAAVMADRDISEGRS